jgi:hypothetical protein
MIGIVAGLPGAVLALGIVQRAGGAAATVAGDFVDIVGGPAAMTRGLLTAATRGLTLWDILLYGLVAFMASAAVLFGVLLWRDSGGNGSDGEH